MKLPNLWMKLLLMGVLAAVIVGCSSTPKGVMTVTTDSKEALAKFEEGRELWEKLRGLEALQYFQEAIALDSNFALAYLHMAFTSQSAKDFFADLDKAVALADKVSEGERLWILGSEAGANGDPMKQREYFRQLVAQYPNDKRAWNVLGNHYFGQQEYELAIEQYKKAIELDSNFSQPYNQYGYALRFLGKYDEAEKVFKKYIELIPNDPNPYDSYAELLLKMGRFDESIAEYRKALEVKADFFASHVGIATNLTYQGKYDEALAQLQTMYDMSHNDGQRRFALATMALVESERGNYDAAIKHYEAQLALAQKINDNAAASGDYFNMGNTMFEAGKYDQAMDLFKKGLDAIEAASVSEEVKNNTRRFYTYCEARIALKRKNISKAKELAATFSQQAETARNTFQIWLSHELNGMIAMDEKNFDLALAEYMKGNQQNSQTLYAIAMCYKSKGDIAKAKEYFSKVANFNQPIGLNQAFAREKAKRMLASI